MPARSLIDVRRLRHRAERPRFAFAAAASILLIGFGLLLVARLASSFWLAGIGAVVLLALASISCAVQVYRAGLLGGAVRVTPDTFPVLSAAAAEVRQQLGYDRPVDIFVAGTGHPVLLTSYLGAHVLVLKGELVADLIKPGNRAQLDFVLATCFGKLKVRAMAWAPARVAIYVLQLPRVLNFLVAPWERATVYTGDQIAATCCGSLDESVIALNRLLVGRDLAASVGMTGLMQQAVTARTGWLPRLPQLYSRYPLMTDRYLNLLSFAGQSAPDEARAFRARLKRDTEIEVLETLARSAGPRHRSPQRLMVPAAIAASIALLGAAAIALFPTASHSIAATLRYVSSTPPAEATTPRAAPSSPALVLAGCFRRRRFRLPAASALGPSPDAQCCGGWPWKHTYRRPSPVRAPPSRRHRGTTGLLAAVRCTPTGSGAPAHVEYYQYENGADMNAAFRHRVVGIPASGSCDQGGRSGTYQFARWSAGGAWACYYDSTGTSQMIWTSSALNILAAANARAQTPQQLNDWFFSPAQTGPR